jgi:hypothetical protein
VSGATIGRIVHYVMRPDDYLPPSTYFGSDAEHHRAAIVVENFDPSGDTVNLMVLPDGMNDGHNNPFFVQSVFRSVSNEPGTWHWPERDADSAAGKLDSPAALIPAHDAGMALSAPAAGAAEIDTPIIIDPDK